MQEPPTERAWGSTWRASLALLGRRSGAYAPRHGGWRDQRLDGRKHEIRRQRRAGPDEKERGPLLAAPAPGGRRISSARAPYNAGASAPEAPLRVDPPRFDDLFGKLRPRAGDRGPERAPRGPQHAGRSRADEPEELPARRAPRRGAAAPLAPRRPHGARAPARRRDQPEQAQMELDRLWNGSPFVREVLGLLPMKTRGAARRPRCRGSPAATNVDSLLDMVDLGGTASGRGRAPQRYEAPPPAPVAEMPNKNLSTHRVGRAERASTAARRRAPDRGREPRRQGDRRADRRDPPAPRGAPPRAGVARPALPRGAHARATRHPHRRRQRAAPTSAAAALQRAIRDNAASEPPVSCAIVDLADRRHRAGLRAPRGDRRGRRAPHRARRSSTARRSSSASTISAGVEKLDNKAALFQTPQQAPWRSRLGEARAALGRDRHERRCWRARAYDKTTSRVREATVKELPDDDGAFVWIDARLRRGDPGADELPRHRLALPHPRRPQRRPRRQSPRARGQGRLRGRGGHRHPDRGLHLHRHAARALARAGSSMLASAPNSDAVYVHSAPTAYVTPPKQHLRQRARPSPRCASTASRSATSSSSPASCSSSARSARSCPPSSDPAEVQPVMEGALWALFENAAPGSVELSVRPRRGAEGTVVGARRQAAPVPRRADRGDVARDAARLSERIVWAANVTRTGL